MVDIKSMILAKVREVWERKLLDYIEPTHALIIRDNVYLSVAASCTFDEFKMLVREMAAEGLLTIHETAMDTGLRLPIEKSEL